MKDYDLSSLLITGKEENKNVEDEYNDIFFSLNLFGSSETLSIKEKFDIIYFRLFDIQFIYEMLMKIIFYIHENEKHKGKFSPNQFSFFSFIMKKFGDKLETSNHVEHQDLFEFINTKQQTNSNFLRTTKTHQDKIIVDKKRIENLIESNKNDYLILKNIFDSLERTFDRTIFDSIPPKSLLIEEWWQENKKINGSLEVEYNNFKINNYYFSYYINNRYQEDKKYLYLLLFLNVKDIISPFGYEHISNFLS